MFSAFQVFMEPLKKVQVEGFLMFAEPEVLFGNLDELCCVSIHSVAAKTLREYISCAHFEKMAFVRYLAFNVWLHFGVFRCYLGSLYLNKVSLNSI